MTGFTGEVLVPDIRGYLDRVLVARDDLHSNNPCHYRLMADDKVAIGGPREGNYLAYRFFFDFGFPTSDNSYSRKLIFGQSNDAPVMYRTPVMMVLFHTFNPL